MSDPARQYKRFLPLVKSVAPCSIPTSAARSHRRAISGSPFRQYFCAACRVRSARPHSWSLRARDRQFKQSVHQGRFAPPCCAGQSVRLGRRQGGDMSASNEVVFATERPGRSAPCEVRIHLPVYSGHPAVPGSEGVWFAPGPARARRLRPWRATAGVGEIRPRLPRFEYALACEHTPPAASFHQEVGGLRKRTHEP